jgi:hypothetical protein
MNRKGKVVMLRSVEELYGYSVQAIDGDIGEVYEFYFDDKDWTIRYLVMDTGGWLSGRLVIISPVALKEPDWKKQIFPVSITKKQVEKGPSTYAGKPISRKYESEVHKHYGWPSYWSDKAVNDESRTMKRGESHLRSTREVTGYDIQAIDDGIGHVEDFIIDDEVWIIRYMVIDTRDWLPGGKKVLVSPQWIKDVSWVESKVNVELHKEAIVGAPEYDTEVPVNRDYEEKLYEHYGSRKYWD